ncbi:MAG: ATP-binding protein [Cyanobacteria bacterium J06659_2]
MRVIQRLNHARWQPFVAETRNQILLCYIGLMVLFVGVALPCIYYILFREVDRRVEVDLIDEVREFQDALREQPLQTVSQMQRLMVDYIRDELVEDDQYLIFMVNGQPYAFEPDPLPIVMQAGSPLMEEWRLLEQQTQGDWMTTDPQMGKLLYAVEPILVDGQVRGLFIIARSTSAERAEIDRIVRTVLLIMLLLLLLAALVAWWLSARILQPLRSLSSTARSISETDLSQRIPVRGTGELAEVATTFNDMMDRLQLAFTSQQDFIRDASHELRTPITIVQGHLELMGDDPEEQREVLELVLDELDRMNRFVKDMLMLAKADRPDFIEPEALDLEKLTGEIYDKAKVITQCHCKLSQSGHGTVWLDRQRITQAMVNLVENANQHTPKAGQITLGSSRNHQYVRFWVTDTGKGISPQDQTRIFERFARVTSEFRQSEGAGLGLPIVHAIAQASGGRVELQSALGQGSTFMLVFPLRSLRASKP